MKDRNFPVRMWINQPSTAQTYHNLNGTNVLAVWEGDNTYRVFFLSGNIESQQMSSLALSAGWLIADEQKQFNNWWRDYLMDWDDMPTDIRGTAEAAWFARARV